MTKTFKISLATGLVAVALAAGSAIVMAQDGQMRRGPGMGGPPPGGPMGGQMRGPGGPMGIGPAFRELDLTDDQKGQIKSIHESHQAEFRAAGEKVGASREGMRKLLEADTLDEPAVRAKSVEVAAAEADAAILGAKVRAQTLQVLTSEQLAKLNELRASREAGPRKQRQQGRR